MLHMQGHHVGDSIGALTWHQATQILRTAPMTPQQTVPQRPSYMTKRAGKVDPCKGRCLIQNVSHTHGVAYTHCVPIDLREWDDDLVWGSSLFFSSNWRVAFWFWNSKLTKVEWYWGMRYFTLNLDTRYNVFPGMPRWHSQWANRWTIYCLAHTSLRDPPEDRKVRPMWLLLPEKNTIQRFHDTLSRDQQDDWITTRGRFPEFQVRLVQMTKACCLELLMSWYVLHRNVFLSIGLFPCQAKCGKTSLSIKTWSHLLTSRKRNPSNSPCIPIHSGPSLSSQVIFGPNLLF